MKKIINVTGLGASGSSAVIDLLQEYSCNKNKFEGIGFTYEHTFLWHPNGLIETYIDLKNTYFGLQTDAIIRRFIKQMNLIIFNDVYYGKTFSNEDKKNFEVIFWDYIDNICKLDGEFPSTFLEQSELLTKLRIFFCKFGITSKLIHRLYSKYYGWYTLKVNNNQLCSYTKKIIYDYLGFFSISEKNLLLDAFLPVEYFKYIPELFDNDLYSIIVMRDPRDRYLDEMLCKEKGLLPIVSCDAALYSQNYLKAMECVKANINHNCLTIWFEDLVLHYDTTVKKIENFLRLDTNQHNVMNGKIFDISKSIHNMKLYQKEELRNKYLSEILTIERVCKNFLYVEDGNI